MKVAFTKRYLDDLEPPASGRLTVYDTKTSGLAVIVTASGHKSLYYYRWASGRPAKICLGPWPATTLEFARQEVSRIHSELLHGQTPRRYGSRSMTLGQLWQEFSAKTTHRRSTQSTNQSRYDTCLASLADLRLTAISHERVVRLHQQLGGELGQTTANRAVQLLRRLFNFAHKTLGLKHLTNPAVGITLYRESKRKRFLLPSEVPRWFAALADEPEQDWRDFFALCLYTGARKSNVQAMRWPDLDLDAGVWTIQADEFKTGDVKQIVLPAPALEILRRRRESATGEWVFPSRSVSGHIQEPKKPWAALCKRAGLRDLRIHDLRRTLGSWQAGLGANTAIIGRSLGHESPASTAIYTQLDLDPVRASVEAAVAAILAACGK